jgi:enoyl reductase-like protein
MDNALRRILVPRTGQKVLVKYAGSLPLSVTVYGAARSYGEHIPTFMALSIVFNPETKLIDLTLFEERQDVAVPLSLQFQYCPSQGFAPIHEISSGRNERIKKFYWKLWFGDNEVLPNIVIHENFVGPDLAINSSDVEQFCVVAGNQGELFKVARNENAHWQAPMDFAIVTCWKVIQSQVSFKNKTVYRNVSVSGDIFIRNQLKVLVKVGSVDFQQQDDSQGNPVLAYLQHGTAQGLTTLLANGYSLNTPDVSTTLTLL